MNPTQLADLSVRRAGYKLMETLSEEREKVNEAIHHIRNGEVLPPSAQIEVFTGISDVYQRLENYVHISMEMGSTRSKNVAESTVLEVVRPSSWWKRWFMG